MVKLKYTREIFCLILLNFIIATVGSLKLCGGVF
jgi:hypothetical protein